MPLLAPRQCAAARAMAVAVFAEVQRCASALLEDAGAVGNITAAELAELRSMRQPPAPVRRALELTVLLLEAR